MSLMQDIEKDIKSAILNKDKNRLNTLRAIKSAILLELSKDGNKEVEESVGIQILKKLHKQRKESAEIYQTQGRSDLVSGELAEAAIIETYLPEQLSEDQLKIELNRIIDEVGANSMQDMGKVMGAAVAKLGAKADGKSISAMVRTLLSD